MTQNPGIVALRMDDVGASSKRYEIYSNKRWQIGPLQISGNWLLLKYLRPFRAWGPYRELRVKEWLSLFSLLEEHGAKLTVAVTAAWVQGQGKLIPFPKQFSGEAAVLREGVNQGLVEIANHGLTHCVIENKMFRPKLFADNREFHREFGPSVPAQIQDSHLEQSQDILQSWFGIPVVTFVPPGNVFTEETLGLAKKHGLRFVSCRSESRLRSDPIILGNDHVVAFHDRDIVLFGAEWFRKQLEINGDLHFRFVREVAREMVDGFYGH